MKNFTKDDIVEMSIVVGELAVDTLCGIGVGMIFDGVVEVIAPKYTKPLAKVALKAGKITLQYAGMAQAHSIVHGTVQAVRDVKKGFDEARKSEENNESEITETLDNAE